MIKVIMFDFDGVIMDTFNVAYLAWKHISEEFDAKIKIKDEDQYRKLFTCNIIDMLYSIGLSEKELQRTKEIWPEFQEKYTPKIFGGIKKVLNELSQKYTLALVSGSIKELIEPNLKQNGLFNLFKVIVPIIEVDKNKPNPYHVNLAIKKLKINPEEIIYVGDTTDDIKAAREAGIKKVIAVSYGFNSAEILQNENPTKIINSPDEILDAINEIK